MVSKIIAFANQKGGVGKTTSCINLAASLGLLKKKVLLIDLDPQGNATMGSGVNKSNLLLSINEVLLGQAEIKNAIIPNVTGGYDLLPSNSDLTQAEVGLMQIKKKEQRLKTIINYIKNQFDFILIDCPPSLNMLTLNALVAANSIVIPMQCEYYALEGLSALLGTIKQVKEYLNQELYIEGIIQTMYDPRNRLSRDVALQLKNHFGNKVYKSAIPRNVRLAEAPSHGLPVVIYDRSSKGAIAYLAVAKQLLKTQSSRRKSLKKEVC